MSRNSTVHVSANEQATNSTLAPHFMFMPYVICSVSPCSSSPWLSAYTWGLIPLFELTYMCYLILAVIVCAIIVIVNSYGPLAGKYPFTRWKLTTYVFFEYIEELVSYSALKILYSVLPSVLAIQGYERYLDAREAGSTAKERICVVLGIIKFVLLRCMFALIGFDVFLMKLQFTATLFLAAQENGAIGTVFPALVSAFTFLYQTLGAAKMNLFVRERLFIFIFGGQAGDLDRDEKVLVEVWQAMLARRIFEVHGLCKGVIVMLGFDDYDFQMLVLDDDEEQRRRHAKENSFNKFDRVIVRRANDIHYGKYAVVVNPRWEGLVKVRMEDTFEDDIRREDWELRDDEKFNDPAIPKQYFFASELEHVVWPKLL